MFFIREFNTNKEMLSEDVSPAKFKITTTELEINIALVSLSIIRSDNNFLLEGRPPYQRSHKPKIVCCFSILTE